HAHEFPMILQMAFDLLAVSGSSVLVEHLLFSSHHLCTNVQSSPKAETISQAMC
ncbi:hypothetical protein WOLCODRAFT_84172, partial [Wolfiporia cocos MD-104 SS10]